MKAVKIVLLSILALVVIVFVGLFIFLKTFDVNKYLPQITKQAGDAIHRQVDIANADLGLSFKGLSLKLNQISVSEDPAFGQDAFVKIDNIALGVEFMPLLTKREVHITEVRVNRPFISIIRLADGRINAQAIGSSAVSTPAPAVPAAAGSAQTQPSSNNQALPTIIVKSIKFQDGQVAFEDKTESFPVKMLITNLEASVDDFSSVEPFDFVLTANILAKGNSNVTVNGRCTLDLAKNAANISDLKVTSELNQWDWAKVKTISPVLEKLPVWPTEIKGKVLLDESSFNASASGLENFLLQIGLTDGSIKLKELSSPLDQITIKAETDAKDLIIKSVTARLAEGQLSLDGILRDMATAPSYQFNMDAQGIKVENLLDQTQRPITLKAGVNGKFVVSGASFDQNLMMKNLKGKGNINLSDGKIQKLNILKLIVSKLSFIPGIQDKFDSLSEEVRNQLNQDTTILNKAEAALSIQNELINVDNAIIESPGVALDAKGTAGFDSSVNLNLNFYLSSDVSAALVSSARPLSGLLDAQQRIMIPAQVSGKAPAIKFKMEVGDLAQKAAMAEGQAQLGRVLDKNPEVKNILNSILGGGSSQQQPAPEGQQAVDGQTQAQPQEKSSEELVNDLFNAFKKKKKE